MASPLLLVVVFCSYCCYIAHAGDEHGFVRDLIISSSSLLWPSPHLRLRNHMYASRLSVNLERSSATASVPLVHRYGPCAPLRYSDVPMPSFSETLRRSRARTYYIKSRASMDMASTPDDAAVTAPTHLGGFVDSLEYVVTLGFGTPSVPQVLLMDTGSSFTWVQCTPCNSTKCYPQKDPLFDPSKSSTYAPIACDTDTCRKLGKRYKNGCTSGGTECGYFVGYGDGSRTRGVYSNETLTLAPGVTVKDFRFGCGHDQRGPNDKYDGLLGLGGAPESLAVQTSSVYGGAFSYCLPALNSQAGFLSLGAPSANTSAFVFTPMGHLPGWPTFYMVNMTGISVGGKPLDIPQSAFRGGMIIDSGTIATELPETAYNAVEAALRTALAAYPMVASEDFDTCYNFTGYSNVTVPRVAFTFRGGATIDLDVPNGILVKDCLAFRESGPDVGLGTIGNVNQRTLEVLYDAGRGIVGFRADAC
ncbi:aspartyl protease family protein At5g10770-like [Miscanthus floridulus]|uniref:aspartyl protease family protein At5g10770-like n=1 Tax=Miscanthus floridulus TaxID=154761 RepID=UPI003459C7FE